uniref:cytoplasmic 60S subunit biogenesis factor ZNF622 n=1 Tax=Myxine glutinosa TaxID=7769 RepID=UPI0035902D07
MSALTCITCRVVFSSAELQRAHYKSDWHRYNLKRKVANLQPVTAEVFQEKVLAQRTATTGPEPVQCCALCGKTFASTNTFNNHLGSQKHRQAETAFRKLGNRAVQSQVNKKNIENGQDVVLADDGINKAIQQAMAKGAQKPPGAPVEGETRTKKRRQKPPRLVWLEKQAAKLHLKEHTEHKASGTDEDEDEWEDFEEVDFEDEGGNDDEEDDDEEMAAELPASEGALSNTTCLFCPHLSASLAENMAHMSRDHGFFIPDIEYLVDLPGLMSYLGEKVGAGNVCLWCNENGRSFYTLEAVQGHMRDKGHCKVFADGDALLELSDFFDFRPSYPDYKGGVAGDSDDEDEEAEDILLKYDEDTMELQLPSGAKIGHRSLMIYFKQRFGKPQTIAVRKNTHLLGRVMQQYRVLGRRGDEGGETAFKRRRDMRCLQRSKAKWSLKMGLLGNSLQHHFRPQVIF